MTKHLLQLMVDVIMQGDPNTYLYVADTRQQAYTTCDRLEDTIQGLSLTTVFWDATPSWTAYELLLVSHLKHPGGQIV